MRNVKRSRLLVFAAVAFIVIAGVAGWWIERSGSENSSLPRRVCHGFFAGKDMEKFIPGEGEYKSHVDSGFPHSVGASITSVCEIERGHEELRLSTQFPVYKSPKNQVHQGRRKITLGKARGFYSSSQGTVGMYIPCANAKSPDLSLFVVAGYSKAVGKVDERNPAVSRLARLSGYSGRKLAKTFECRDRHQLADGPVRFAK